MTVHRNDPPLLRELRFGVGVGHVYMRLKMASTLIGLRRHVLGCSEAACEARWDCVHRSVGQELGRICTGLGGFHVKVGQFFATRPDLVPPQWCRELSILCDAVEPVPGGQCRALAEAELGTSFLAWDDVPLGSASVAQVHAARMRFRTRRGRQASRAVAVKVRRPETRFFERDLRSVRTASGLLQRFEVDFDLLSAIDELRGRVAIELDFRNEYHNLRTAGAALRHTTRGAVAAPIPISATQACLVTELLEGYTTLAALTRRAEGHGSVVDGGGSSHSGRRGGRLEGLLGRRFGRRALTDVIDAYGQMLLLSPCYHADPHPGNMMLPDGGWQARGWPSLARSVRRLAPPGLRRLLPMPAPRVYIVDWGQCGGPTTAERRRQLARLYEALAAMAEAGEPDSIAGIEPATAGEVGTARALRCLGVLKPGMEDDGVEARMARGLFDSGGEFVVESKAQQRKHAKQQAGDVPVPQGGVEVLPQDLLLVIRVTQMLRGLAAATDDRIGGSSSGSGVPTLAKAWKRHAKRALRAAV